MLFTLTICSSVLLSAPNYTVRLAVYKNANTLQHKIATYPPALKQTVKTYKRKGNTYAYTIPTADKATLTKLLPAYKKVFKDAYIKSTRLK